MIEKLFDGTIYKVAKKSLDGYAERQRVIAHNIANVNTPNYKAQRVNFEEAIAKAIQSGDKKSIDNVTNSFSFDENNSTLRNDGNNINLEREMERLGKTQLGFKMYTKIAKWKMGMMKSAITKGQ